MDLFNPHSSDWLKNKFSYYDEIRALDSLYYSNSYNMYVITDYDDVLTVLKDTDTFTSSLGNLIVENPARFGKTLGASDNPEHDLYKQVVKNSYSKHNSDRILESVKASLDTDIFKSETLNITDISFEISSLVTAHLLNISDISIAKAKDLIVHIQKRAEQCVKYNTSQKGYNALVSAALTKPVLETNDFGIYSEYHASTCPIKNISLFTGPCISGTSSLVGAIQYLVLDCYRYNVTKQLLQNSALTKLAIQESLRLNASTGRFSRTATKNTVLKNTVIPANYRIAVCLDAANRDPKVFIDPDKFSINRNSTKHLAYGYGLHSCIALYLSNSILELFLKTLLENFGDYKVVNEESLEYIITNSGNNDMFANLIIQKQ